MGKRGHGAQLKFSASDTGVKTGRTPSIWTFAPEERSFPVIKT